MVLNNRTTSELIIDDKILRFSTNSCAYVDMPISDGQSATSIWSLFNTKTYKTLHLHNDSNSSNNAWFDVTNNIVTTHTLSGKNWVTEDISNYDYVICGSSKGSGYGYRFYLS